ncbi:MAG: VOC family protein [Spongiibacteraceae bacterium]
MSIFTHVVIGANNIDQARTFFDAALAPLGINRISSGESQEPVAALMYGVDAPSLIVTLPRDGNAATHANGGTIGLVAPNPAAVDAFHAAALANGGSCEGEPGSREGGGPNAYGAYVRDPVGNKICAFSFG